MNRFIIKGNSDCVAIDCKPSEELKRYHQNSSIQINIDGETYLRKAEDVESTKDNAIQQ